MSEIVTDEDAENFIKGEALKGLSREMYLLVFLRYMREHDPRLYDQLFEQ